ncbi:hypothetical protein [Ligilactobacillus murinus]|uniref:Uncharacterized protein n=1 Tax=Ligilactobacillus murinus TaxID=1622 RepID=A0AAE6WHW5_9LACO|nr:hypothetical protein [Ligilactobacillus murinus]NEF82735.1 hypothetical protein [Ligilactobacillus murinus]NEF84317.1 hypothetical protein [Ligilactobacillus murinus]NEF87311.1 hypothetical protein [Ligilactobacillus murinus]NEF89645.1 hypothetical protein [Ligilactobacillus murinus]NEF91897.1 hypothetical protein [Ligilactobacillus murinus]
MSKKTPIAGNKMSLRQTAFTIVHRVEFISNILGPLGDMLSSTWISIILSIVVGGFSIIGALLLVALGTGLNNLGNVLLPFIAIVLGAALLTINVLMVNPSQGSQFKVSFRYWINELYDSKKGYRIKLKPFAFSKKSEEKDIIEQIFDGKRYYFTVIKIQGKVSQTSFDSDLLALSDLNKDSLGALERDTQRTVVNYIGTPHIKEKVLPSNATPSMKRRLETLSRVINELDDAQTLETYMILASKNHKILRVKRNNQFKHLNAGLVTTAYQIKGTEAKKVIKKLLG